MQYWVTIDWGPGVEDKPHEAFVTVDDGETNVEASIKAQLQSDHGLVPESIMVGGSALPNGGILAADPEEPNKKPVTGASAKVGSTTTV